MDIRAWPASSACIHIPNAKAGSVLCHTCFAECRPSDHTLTTFPTVADALSERQFTSRRKGPPRRSASGCAEATPWLPARLGCGAGLAGVQAPAARLAAMLTSWEQPLQLVTVVGPPGIGAHAVPLTKMHMTDNFTHGMCAANMC